MTIFCMRGLFIYGAEGKEVKPCGFDDEADDAQSVKLYDFPPSEFSRKYSRIYDPQFRVYCTRLVYGRMQWNFKI
jgi:hypothetical protein